MFSPGLFISEGLTGLLPLLSITGKSAEGEAFIRTCHYIVSEISEISYSRSNISYQILSHQIVAYRVSYHIMNTYIYI